jgi:hypothetical protein
VARGMRFCRIDGSLGAEERHAQVAQFQGARSSNPIPVFLLTSQASSVDSVTEGWAPLGLPNTLVAHRKTDQMRRDPCMQPYPQAASRCMFN